ncbi:hypothetical protein QVD17_06764 [Tagetes erecta]|uniref:DUF7950 domain-containing protein n=1 Tax=Tagetes erecta TaxID=13708 RepID=A0AAD8LE83_TARER|nr:hypothetical protein QVD17_06764 [Tagetes erecta]
MLRYRPIAPKPVTDLSSGNMLPEKVFTKRVKRKYVRVKKTMKKKKKNKAESNFVTKNWSDLDALINDDDVAVIDPLHKVSNWISFDSARNDVVRNNLFEKFSSDLHGVDLDRRNVVESWITVESVTGSCEDRKILGYTDDEIWKNLERDSCPGFMSNSCYEVEWVNPAYRNMLNLDCLQVTDVAVLLVLKVEKSLVVKYLPAFSCRVRIEYRLSEKKRRMMVPCDVCKMDSGGFAWRLDVKFALSLGPSSS